MDSAIRVVSSPATGAGFQLAGVEPVVVATPEAARLGIQEVLRQPGLGVVLIEEPLYAGLGETGQRAISRHPLPMVVPFPGPSWAGRVEAPEEFIAELLRQAIGYRVKLG